MWCGFGSPIIHLPAPNLLYEKFFRLARAFISPGSARKESPVPFFINWMRWTEKPEPTALRAVPRAEVVFPFPLPQNTWSNPRCDLFGILILIRESIKKISFIYT